MCKPGARRVRNQHPTEGGLLPLILFCVAVALAVLYSSGAQSKEHPRHGWDPVGEVVLAYARGAVPPQRVDQLPIKLELGYVGK